MTLCSIWKSRKPRTCPQNEALVELGKLSAPGRQRNINRSAQRPRSTTTCLPHIGEGTEERREKGKYLIQMARKASIVGNRLARRGRQGPLREQAGQILWRAHGGALRIRVQILPKEVKYQIERTSARGRKLSIQSIISPDTITEKIAYAMGTGTWVAGQTGVSQVLDRTNLISTYTHLRRVKSPLAKKHPHFKARDVPRHAVGQDLPIRDPRGTGGRSYQVSRHHGEDNRWR